MPDDGTAVDTAVDTPVTAPHPTVPRSSRPVLSRHVRLQRDRARDRDVLLGPESVIVLNATGADILGLCDGQRTVADVAAALAARYDRVVDHEVAAFLARLVERHCVEIHDG